GRIVGLLGHQAEAGKHGGERENRRWIGNGKRESRKVGEERTVAPCDFPVFSGAGDEGSDPKVAEEESTQDSEPESLPDEEIRYRSEAKSRDASVTRIRGGGTESGGEANQPAV